MLTDDELTRLLHRLEQEPADDGGSIERAFEEVDRQRRALRSARRAPLLATLRFGCQRLRLGLQTVALLMLLSLLMGLLFGGLFVGSRLLATATAEPSPSVLAIAPDLRVPLAGRPYALTTFEGDLWVANGHTVDRMNPLTGNLIATIDLGSGEASVSAGPAGLWVSISGSNLVGEVDPVRNALARSITVEKPQFVAVGQRDVWVASTETGFVTRIDATTGEIVAPIFVGSSPSQPAVTDDAVWVPHDCIMGTPAAPEGTPSISRIDPTANTVSGRVVGDGFACVRGILLTAGEVWFADANDGTISEVDPSTVIATRTFGAGERAGSILDMRAAPAFGFPGALWVTRNPSVATSGIALIDAATGSTGAILDLGFGPERSTHGLTRMLVVGASVWLAADFFEQPELLRVDLRP